MVPLVDPFADDLFDRRDIRHPHQRATRRGYRRPTTAPRYRRSVRRVEPHHAEQNDAPRCRRVTIADRTWDTLPPEIHSRIMAATAHASERVIRQCDPPESDPLERSWEVSALAGDRFVHMFLGLRADGSVSEATATFLVADLLDISFDADGALDRGSRTAGDHLDPGQRRRRSGPRSDIARPGSRFRREEETVPSCIGAWRQASASAAFWFGVLP